MRHHPLLSRRTAGLRTELLAALAVFIPGLFILTSGHVEYRAAHAPARGGARLIAAVPIPETAGVMCEWMPASYPPAQAGAPASVQAARPSDTTRRKPIRTIHDNYPAFSSVAVDVKNNEVIVTDENLFQLLVYNRTAPTPPPSSFSEPKRILSGPNTKIEFQCGLYVDPNSGDVYAVNNDTVDTLVIFTREQKGNVPATRELEAPHRAFGVTVDEEAKELFVTVQVNKSLTTDLSQRFQIKVAMRFTQRLSQSL